MSKTDWEYSVDYLAWVNNKTGQVSETNPAEEITIVSRDELEEWDKANRELPALSAALAYRRLWPDDDDAMSKAFSLMNPEEPQDIVEDVIRRTKQPEKNKE